MKSKYDYAPWMITAESYVGVKEIAGDRHNPVIVKFFAESGFPDIVDDETAWCSAYTNAVLYEHGYSGTRDLMARSWLSWKTGQTVVTPRFGDIVIFSRGSDPIFGHVGFFIKWDDTWVWVLGGNQANSVSVTRIARSKLIGIRRPRDKGPTEVSVPKMTQKSTPWKWLRDEELVVISGGGVGAIGTVAEGSPLLGLFLFCLMLAVAGYMVLKRS
jgi:uncharacterized protein (TIGR02594 family)